MHSEGGLNLVAVMGEISAAIRLTLAVRGAVALPDGGVGFAVGPRRAHLTVTVHVCSEDLYDVVLCRAGRPLSGWVDASPESLGAIVRQLVNSTFPEDK